MTNEPNGTDESMNEQDIVYYQKEDLTNFSKGLGLNKVKRNIRPKLGSDEGSQDN